jgi:peptide/nickel transport system ATP-binding protein
MANPASTPILEISRLTVGYRAAGGAWLDAVREVSLSIQPGQVVGLVGESGSGKSSLALAVMRYLPPGGAVRAGEVRFAGRDVYALSPAELQGIRGTQVAFIPQDPFSALNPSLKIGVQIGEVLRWHQALPPRAARAQARRLLHAVRMPDPDRALDSYPHQLSGGMQQRALIALALSADPLLLVLDEPTTALDVTTEAAILDVFRGLMDASNAAALYVTHNLGVVARICDRVAVLYASELVEDAPTADLYRQPLHPYTRGLLDSVPRLGEDKHLNRLTPIGGRIPHLDELPPGCVFAPRCPLAVEQCHITRPPLEEAVPGRRVRCHRWPEILAGSVPTLKAAAAPFEASQPVGDVLLALDDLRVHYREVRALDGVSLTLGAGHTLGIVGESGSGKTTLARAIFGLVEPTAGGIQFAGVSLPRKLSRRPAAILRKLQMVFQNPLEALNPYLTIGEILSRPFIRLLGLSRKQAFAEAVKLLTAVRLPEEYATRLPRQLSGGERQRVAIARAFAASPDLLVADEPVSALDVSVQASILNLLNELQWARGTAMVFISHDLSVVAYLANEVAVMYLGRVVQVAGARVVFEAPYHPYTEALLSAIPIPDPAVVQETMRLEGEVPGAAQVPPGCPFHTRCPRVVGEICRTEMPPWQDAGGGKRILCHIPPEELVALQGRVIGAGRQVDR